MVATERAPLRKSESACDLIKKIQTGGLSYHIIQGIPVEIGGKSLKSFYVCYAIDLKIRLIFLKEFPHMAAIAYRDEVENKVTYDCGGSLISKVIINILRQIKSGSIISSL